MSVKVGSSKWGKISLVGLGKESYLIWLFHEKEKERERDY